MSLRIYDNLGGLVAATSSPLPNKQRTKPQIGKVFGVLIDESSVPKDLFDKSGGWNGIGTIFYLDYEQSKDINTVDLYTCKIAKPFHSSNQNYPLIGELVHLIDAPNPFNQIQNNTTQKYYTGTINIWNSPQQNSPTGVENNKTFTETADVRNLISFAGDRIYQGRKGNGIRFGSTIKSKSNLNEWSNTGNNGDPITIMVNGYVTTDTGSLVPNVEEINKEMSSIYMTSTQKLPLQPGASIINPRVNTIKPSNYTSSQIILNSDRITLNAKKDEVLLFAKGNIELNTNNIININAGRVTHINSPNIALGTKSNGEYPDEAVLLGNQTIIALDKILSALQILGGYLKTASVATTEGAIAVTSCQLAGEQLLATLPSICDQLEKCLSTKVYTV